MSFVQPVPTYIEFLETVLNIQDCLHSFQSETQLDIIRHIYPYTIQVSILDSYNHFHIYTLQDILHLYYNISQVVILPF